MKRPQYVFRPNLSDPQHRRVWALLQQVPPAKRKEFLVQSILAAEQTDRLEKSIRKVVREELQAVNITGAVPSPLSENLSTFIFSLIRAVGLILLGWGIVQVGLSLQSHDPSQRSQGFLTLAGGLVITFAKEILDLITA